MTPRVLFRAQSVDWQTPVDLYKKLDAEFHFDLDPCPLFGADSDGDGLLASWIGRRVFCNPPYGDVTAWLRRAGDARVAAFLLPARTDTKWFHELCLPHAKEIRFIKGRLRFSGAKENAPFPSMVVVFE